MLQPAGHIDDLPRWARRTDNLFWPIHVDVTGICQSNNGSYFVNFNDVIIWFIVQKIWPFLPRIIMNVINPNMVGIG